MNRGDEFSDSGKESAMNESERAGRQMLVAVIAGVLGFSVTSIVLFNIAVGSHELPTQIIRFSLTCVLCFFLYRGHQWARWVVAVLLIVAALGVLPTLKLLGVNVTLHPLIVLMIAFYLSAAGLLLFSSKIKSFLAEQKARRKPRGASVTEDDSAQVQA
jgi:hypothetical protein